MHCITTTLCALHGACTGLLQAVSRARTLGLDSAAARCSNFSDACASETLWCSFAVGHSVADSLDGGRAQSPPLRASLRAAPAAGHQRRAALRQGPHRCAVCCEALPKAPTPPVFLLPEIMPHGCRGARLGCCQCQASSSRLAVMSNCTGCRKRADSVLSAWIFTAIQPMFHHASTASMPASARVLSVGAGGLRGSAKRLIANQISTQAMVANSLQQPVVLGSIA